jgi:uncharacterized protein involved in oxidation of intracellular sulfur
MATILYVGTNGSDDPTRASMPFHAATGAIEAGHQAQVALLGEATYLIKEGIAATIQGVGMPSLTDLMAKIRDHEVPIYV